MNAIALCRSARASALDVSSQVLRLRGGARGVSTLPSNPHIHVFEHPSQPSTHILSLLPTFPPTPSLAIGTTTKLPPTPDSFTENPQFLSILQSVLHTYASLDPDVRQQAAVFASPGSFNVGGAGRGGWLHVSDTRNPPDWGRIAWPEDIFGSLEVDGRGEFVGERGNYQTSGTYRVVTREGILGLPAFLREKLVERLRGLEAQEKQKKSGS